MITINFYPFNYFPDNYFPVTSDIISIPVFGQELNILWLDENSRQSLSVIGLSLNSSWGTITTKVINPQIVKLSGRGPEFIYKKKPIKVLSSSFKAKSSLSTFIKIKIHNEEDEEFLLISLIEKLCEVKSFKNSKKDALLKTFVECLAIEEDTFKTFNNEEEEIIQLLTILVNY